MMKRVEAMLAQIEDLMELNIEKAKQEFIVLTKTQGKSLVEALKAMVRENELSNSGTIAITYLHSSYVTESHKFKIAFYSDQLFVEEPLVCTYYSLSPFFNEKKIDVEIFKKMLDKTFIRIMASEIDWIRRVYMARLYIAGIEFFRQSLNNEEAENKRYQVFYGEEMGKIERIGLI